MKVLLCTKYSLNDLTHVPEVHGIYESTEEFVRTNTVSKTSFSSIYMDKEFMYKLEEHKLQTNNGTYNSIKDGSPTIAQRLLRVVHHSVPVPKERNYNYMTLDSAQYSMDTYGIAVVCSADFSTVKLVND